MGERAKVTIRNARRDGNKALDGEEKDKTMSEDEAKAGKDQIQELTKSYESQVEERVGHKTAEIMEV